MRRLVPAYRSPKLSPRRPDAPPVVLGDVATPRWERVAARLNPLHAHRCPCRGGQPPHDGPGCGPCACGETMVTT